MGKIRTRRQARSLGRQGFAFAAVAAFLLINAYLLLRQRAPALDQEVVAGEGAHRYRQTEEPIAASVVDTGGEVAAAAAAVGAGAGASGGTAAAADTTAATAGAAGAGDACHTEQDAEYDAEAVVLWGDKNYLDTPQECCAACQAMAPRCNVWVYCGQASGCPAGRSHKECWLKRSEYLDPLQPRGRRVPGSGWVSGATYSEAERAAALQRLADVAAGEQQYLEGLRSNESLPMVFLDVEIQKQPVGRIEMVLFPHISPRCAENFRQLCTGESGVVPTDPPGREGAGKARHFKGAYFYRIIDQFIDQTGVETESVFGGQFKDDPGGLKLKHEHKGLLSMANMGHDTNTAHFSIMMGPAHHLDGDYTIFGQVVSGFEVVDAINALSKGKPENTATAAEGAQIVDSGQIRKGTFIPDLTLGL